MSTSDSAALAHGRRRAGLVDAAVLVVLLTLTLVSFWLGESHSAARGWSIALILAVAFAKCAVIGWRYMRLDTAPRSLQAAFAAWVVVFFVLVTVLSTI